MLRKGREETEKERIARINRQNEEIRKREQKILEDKMFAEQHGAAFKMTVSNEKWPRDTASSYSTPPPPKIEKPIHQRIGPRREEFRSPRLANGSRDGPPPDPRSFLADEERDYEEASLNQINSGEKQGNDFRGRRNDRQRDSRHDRYSENKRADTQHERDWNDDRKNANYERPRAVDEKNRREWNQEESPVTLQEAAPASVTPNTEEVKRRGGGARGRGVRGCTIRRTIVNDYEPSLASQNAHRPSPPKMNDLDEVLQRITEVRVKSAIVETIQEEPAAYAYPPGSLSPASFRSCIAAASSSEYQDPCPASVPSSNINASFPPKMPSSLPPTSLEYQNHRPSSVLPPNSMEYQDPYSQSIPRVLPPNSINTSSPLTSMEYHNQHPPSIAASASATSLQYQEHHPPSIAASASATSLQYQDHRPPSVPAPASATSLQYQEHHPPSIAASASATSLQYQNHRPPSVPASVSATSFQYEEHRPASVSVSQQNSYITSTQETQPAYQRANPNTYPTINDYLRNQKAGVGIYSGQQPQFVSDQTTLENQKPRADTNAFPRRNPLTQVNEISDTQRNQNSSADRIQYTVPHAQFQAADTNPYANHQLQPLSVNPNRHANTTSHPPVYMKTEHVREVPEVYSKQQPPSQETIQQGQYDYNGQVADYQYSTQPQSVSSEKRRAITSMPGEPNTLYSEQASYPGQSTGYSNKDIPTLPDLSIPPPGLVVPPIQAQNAQSKTAREMDQVVARKETLTKEAPTQNFVNLGNDAYATTTYVVAPYSTSQVQSPYGSLQSQIPYAISQTERIYESTDTKVPSQLQTQYVASQPQVAHGTSQLQTQYVASQPQIAHGTSQLQTQYVASQPQVAHGTSQLQTQYVASQPQVAHGTSQLQTQYVASQPQIAHGTSQLQTQYVASQPQVAHGTSQLDAQYTTSPSQVPSHLQTQYVASQPQVAHGTSHLQTQYVASQPQVAYGTSQLEAQYTSSPSQVPYVTSQNQELCAVSKTHVTPQTQAQYVPSQIQTTYGTSQKPGSYGVSANQASYVAPQYVTSQTQIAQAVYVVSENQTPHMQVTQAPYVTSKVKAQTPAAYEESSMTYQEDPVQTSYETQEGYAYYVVESQSDSAAKSNVQYSEVNTTQPNVQYHTPPPEGQYGSSSSQANSQYKVSSQLNQYELSSQPNVNYNVTSKPNTQYVMNPPPNSQYETSTQPHMQYAVSSQPNLQYETSTQPHMQYDSSSQENVQYESPQPNAYYQKHSSQSDVPYESKLNQTENQSSQQYFETTSDSQEDSYYSQSQIYYASDTSQSQQPMQNMNQPTQNTNQLTQNLNQPRLKMNQPTTQATTLQNRLARIKQEKLNMEQSQVQQGNSAFTGSETPAANQKAGKGSKNFSFLKQAIQQNQESLKEYLAADPQEADQCVTVVQDVQSIVATDRFVPPRLANSMKGPQRNERQNFKPRSNYQENKSSFNNHGNKNHSNNNYGNNNHGNNHHGNNNHRSGQNHGNNNHSNNHHSGQNHGNNIKFNVNFDSYDNEDFDNKNTSRQFSSRSRQVLTHNNFANNRNARSHGDNPRSFKTIESNLPKNSSAESYLQEKLNKFKQNPVNRDGKKREEDKPEVAKPVIIDWSAECENSTELMEREAKANGKTLEEYKATGDAHFSKIAENSSNVHKSEEQISGHSANIYTSNLDKDVSDVKELVSEIFTQVNDLKESASEKVEVHATKESKESASEIVGEAPGVDEDEEWEDLSDEDKKKPKKKSGGKFYGGYYGRY